MPAQASHSASPQAHPLVAAALDSYIDDMEATLSMQREAGLAHDLLQATLRGLLQRQPMRPDTLPAVVRLQRLWTQAGEHAQALRVIGDDGARVRAELPAAEQADASTRLGFCRLHALAGDTRPEGPAAFHQALAAMERQLASAPLSGQSDDLWKHLADMAEDAGQHECVRRCARARHAVLRTLPERATYGAFDDAVLALRLGDVFAREGLGEEAHQAGQQAFAALAEAAPGDDVDHDDWLRLGRPMLQLAPEHAEALAERVQACLPADTAPAPRREVLVELSRLQARVLHGQGQAAQALMLGRHGRHELDRDDGDDGFSVELIEWLLAAGHLAQAAELACDCVANTRPGSAGPACALALRQDRAESPQAPPVDPYWPLALAHAALQEDLRAMCGDEDPMHCHARLLARAQQLAATAPAIDRAAFDACVAALQAEVLLQQGRDLPSALTLLDFATRHPAHASSKNVAHLWRCRILRLGPMEALRMGFVPCSAAVWNYNLGVRVERLFRDALPADAPWPEAEVSSLARQHYALGLAQFEAFFAAGTGHYKDGGAHVYSMLCNNLAIIAYDQAETAEQALNEALPLHRKGIAASPFAEHYAGILRCCQYARDEPGIVLAADALWHYAADNGYSRHEPGDYVGHVARALDRLDRGLEIGMWLQRLDSWWASLDEDEQGEAQPDYLSAKAQVLVVHARVQPDDVRARVQAMLPALQALGDGEVTRLAGLALANSGAPAEALALYRLGLRQLQPGRARDAEVEEGLRAGIVHCNRLLRPWWRFWG